MTIDPKTCDHVTWFHHAKAREAYWSTFDDQLSLDMIAQWQREKMIAYGQMTEEERACLPHGD